MICHVVDRAAEIGALPVAMIQPSLRTLPVAAIGSALLLESSLMPACRTAVSMAAVTVLANPEGPVALAVSADTLKENRVVSRHARMGRVLDNGRESWQVRTECW